MRSCICVRMRYLSKCCDTIFVKFRTPFALICKAVLVIRYSECNYTYCRCVGAHSVCVCVGCANGKHAGITIFMRVTSLCVQQNHSSAKSPAWANCTKCLFEGRVRLRVGGREGEGCKYYLVSLMRLLFVLMRCGGTHTNTHTHTHIHTHSQGCYALTHRPLYGLFMFMGHMTLFLSVA